MAADAPPEVDAVIALGANLGDRAATIAKVVLELAETFGIELIAVSPTVETVAVRPAGPDPQAPRYLNAVVLVRTFLSPEALLAALHDLERAHGRERSEHWGDRTLDLDIVTYGDLEQQTDDLTIPHPRAHERDFVLRPWLAVDPDAVLPGQGRVADLLARLDAAAHPELSGGAA